MSVPPTGDASSPILEVRDLAVTYGGVVRALRGVSLTVDEGAVVALLGSNGAGRRRCCGPCPARCACIAAASSAAR